MRKLLFSATLSHDPEQLSALHLILPRLYLASSDATRADASAAAVGAADVGNTATMEGDSAYSMPSTLSEHKIICHATKKPMVLLHLLVTQRCSALYLIRQVCSRLESDSPYAYYLALKLKV